MTAKLNLSVPLLRKPATGSFDTRPEAVRAWVDRLPQMHVGETARRIYQTLHEVNHLDINIEHRLEFLEQVAPPLQGLLDSLQIHYTGKPFPLDPKAARVAQLATELRAAMIVGYRIVMQQSDALHWLRHRKWERLWATALHRMLHYFSDVVTIRFQLHQSPIPGAWHMIHSAYRLLEDNSLLEVQVASVGGGAVTTLGHEYKQLLLLALLPPRHMRPAQLDEVRRHMDQWTQALELLRPENAQHCAEAYCIDLDQDTPPGPLWKLRPARDTSVHSLRLLNMAPLLARMERQLAQQSGVVGRVSLPGGGAVQRGTAALLLNCWMRPPQRSDAREAATDPAHTVFGLHKIHTLLSGIMFPVMATETAVAVAPASDAGVSAEPVVPVAPDLKMTDPLPEKGPSMAISLGFVGDREEEADIWNMVYFEAQPAEQIKSWTEVEVAKTYTVMSGELVNRSSGGLGLRFPPQRLDAVHDGDLIAVNTTQDTLAWTLGMVRWLHVAADGSVELGVKRLQQHVVPASIIVELDGKRSAPIDCLLGHERDQLRLVLPHITGLTKKRLLLASGGREVPVILLDEIESSAVFQMFTCTEQTVSCVESAADVAPEDPFDKYKSVWEIL